MAYQKCVLGGYTFPYNPPEHRNPAVRAVSVADTLSGRYFTDWGASASRRDIELVWPTMDAAFFAALEAKAALAGTLAFVDDAGQTFTVIVMPPTYQKRTPGNEAYLSVTVKMYVVSSP